MPARNGLRRRLKALPVVALATVALPCASAAAAAPGLPRTFDVTRVDSPTPVGGGAFGWGIYSADLTGDFKQDLLVAQAQVGTATDPNKIFIFNGVTGALADTITPPEENPLEPVFPAGFNPNTTPIPAGTQYRSPEMGFVYVETMPDLGSCRGGDGPDADKICDLTTIGEGDGIPEILVGSRALRVNATNGATAPTLADPLVGRGYVIDGATRAVLKRIDMPAADRQLLKSLGGRQTFTNSGVTTAVDISTAGAAFGRTMSSAQGMPPCAGLRSENNDSGVGPCPALTRGTGNTTTGSNVLTNVDMPNAENGQMIVGAGLPPGSTIVSGAGTSTLTVRTPPTSNALPLGAGATATATGIALTATDPRYSQAVRIGDLDGGGRPDIVVTARGFLESRDTTGANATTGTAAPGSQCRQPSSATPGFGNSVATGSPSGLPSCSAGKAWTYRGEDIVGTNPQTILETPMYQPTVPRAANPAQCVVPPETASSTTVPCLPNGGIQNADAQTAPAGGEWGGNLFRVGDLVGDDGFPDFIIPYRGAELPLRAPDVNAGLNMGSAYVYNGRTGTLGRTIVSPEPQIRSQFSGNFNAGRAVGDLGATGTPDILLPAALQNIRFADEGRLWVFNGDLNAGGGGEGSWNFAMLNDPEPYIGGNFGGGMTGVGDLVGGPGAPANEVLVGGFRFDNFTEASQNVVPDVNFMNATLDKNLMTIPHPEGGRGDGFGIGITPMGDLNDDGFLDFAVSAYLADGLIGGQGRAYIFTSDNSPPPPPPTTPAPAAQGPVTPAERGNPLQPGRCANRTMGTDAGDRLEGTLAGDEIFGFGGADTIMAFDGQDCADGMTGADTIDGGDGNDKLLGSTGNDKLVGGDGRDEVFGGTGKDRLEGGIGRDMLAGGPSNDRILGGADDDRLFGEAGVDRIVGGGGRNFVDGGAGNDSIDTRNGERDRVICGTGRDRVRADRYDRLNGCESVATGGKITDRGELPPRVRGAGGTATAARGR